MSQQKENENNFWSALLANSMLRRITQIMVIEILNFSICRTFGKRFQCLKEIIYSAVSTNLGVRSSVMVMFVQLLLLRQTFQKGGKFKDKYLLVGGVSRFFYCCFCIVFFI